MDHYISNSKSTNLENQLDEILKQQLPTENKGMISFQKRLIKYHELLFPFLCHPKVLHDNKASESAIRNIKVKLKIFSQFRTPSGGFAFAVLRSIIDTIIKNRQNVVNSLKVISNLRID